MFDIFYIGINPRLFDHIQPASSIEDAQQKSKTKFCWIVNYLCDYSDFDFLWEPKPWEAHQLHAWPSQWQKNSGTYLVPKSGYSDTNYHDQIVPRVGTSAPRVLIDMNNGRTTLNTAQSIEAEKIVRYFNSYLDTIKRIVNDSTEEFLWVCSSVAIYHRFDFSWHPDIWDENVIHVFPSDEQKYGDTFFIHIPSVKDKINNVEDLEWLGLKFNDAQAAFRMPPYEIVHNYDTHVQAIKEKDFVGPLAVFKTVNNDNFTPPPASTELPVTQLKIPTVSLWTEKTKTIVPLSPGGSTVIVPQAVKAHLHTQLYDYPYINMQHQEQLEDYPLDIVFISNGEPNADYNWEHLNTVTEHVNNRIVRVNGVKGRVAAYHAAANASTTPWFFAVFAKLYVKDDFDWDWQPDRLQQPKHYIFNAVNPCNGLEYGHQAMIAYNKKLVLDNLGQGLDFTLDSEHEVVPLLSGIANYNTSPWVTWRTAFREALKLRADLPNVESEYRLKRWCKEINGLYADWSTIGANDAIEYYNEVNGDFEQLKKSYDWEWLASYAFMKHKLSLDH